MLIETTDNHPFWVEGRGWVFADELKVSSVITSGKRGNSKPFVWNTLKSVDAYVKGDAVVLVNRETNEIVTFLNKKGGRLSSYLKSQLNLIK